MQKLVSFLSQKFIAPSILFGTAIGVVFSRDEVQASDEALEPPSYPWSHRLPYQSFDSAAIRRGYQVYSQICASCHSLKFVRWRNLVNVAYTEDEVKAMAAEVDYEDGPDDTGEMFTRPGKLTDTLPKPYPNSEAARAANSGSMPPDLSVISKARPHGENYIFSLLTGYQDPPPGFELTNNMSYNPYFYGSQIAMPQQLFEDSVTYDDGTPASVSQMAKDVSTFLAWTAEPKHDDRKLIGLKGCAIAAVGFGLMLYAKRLRWGVIKHRIAALKK